MRRLAPVLILLALVHSAYPQKETSRWFMTQNQVLVEKTGMTNVLPSGMPNYYYPYIYSTSVSDANGNLLFASDGQHIIGKDYQMMPTLTGINQMYSFSDLLAVPIPGTQKYYLFYSFNNHYGSRNTNYTLKYSIVDMTLNGGNGDVSAWEQVIDTNVSKGFTVVRGAVNGESWLVSHRIATDSFYMYKIDGAGLSTIPVKCRAGSNPTTIDYLFQQLKTSHDGKMIAGVTYRDYTVIFASTVVSLELFNFDNATGMLSSKVRTQNAGNYFHSWMSVEFSPDNRLLYVGTADRIDGLQPCGWGSSAVVQYNTCYTDSLEFTKYRMTVASEYFWCAPQATWGNIQVGADKKIHMNFSGTTTPAIRKPNRIGSYSNYVFNDWQQLLGNNQYVPVPSFFHVEIEKPIKNNIVYEGGCYPNPITFHITNDTITNIQWDFGDPSSGGNTSAAVSPQHIFSAPGFYTVTAKLYNSSGAFIETVDELVEIKNPNERLLKDYPKDTMICSGDFLRVKLKVVNGIFRWTYRSLYQTQIYDYWVGDSVDISSPGTWFVEMRQNDCDGCTMIDSIKVGLLPVPYFDLGYNSILCSGDSLQLVAQDAAADYVWSTGATTHSIWIKQGGKYWVRGELNNNGCPLSDTVIITDAPNVKFAFPNDTTLCNNQTLLLSPGVTPASYTWQDNTNNTTFMVKAPGRYWARLYNNQGCVYSDTIEVAYVNAQQVWLGNDSTLCAGESVLLDASVPGSVYTWSTGATDATINANVSGKYWVRVDNGNCSVTDTVELQFNTPPLVNLGIDAAYCDGEKPVLKAGVAAANYLWQDGSVKDSIVVQQAGLYWLEVKKNSCTVRDTININYKPIPALSLGVDAGICTGESLLLNAFNPLVNSYQWSDGSSASTLSVRQSGEYFVRVQATNGCYNEDTIKVTVAPLPQFTLGGDTTVCEDYTIKYNFNLPSAQYLWNNNSVSPQFNIDQPGLYWLQVTQGGCSKRDTITISHKTAPTVALGIDTTVCEGNTVWLDAAYAGATYVWSNGVTASSITVSRPGAYGVIVDLDGCKARDTIRVDYAYKPVFDLGKDIELCTGMQLIIDPRFTEGSFVWQDNATTPTYTVKEPGTYQLTITNECGSSSDAVVVKPGLCELIMPNAFTPNDDTYNDVFRVKNPSFIKTFSMKIYNRWGQVIYNSSDATKGWDGTFNSLKQPQDNYIWIISYTDFNGNSGTMKGAVLLLR